MQKEKVEGVLNWPAPRNVKEVQKFLGLANYYRRCKGTLSEALVTLQYSKAGVLS